MADAQKPADAQGLSDHALSILAVAADHRLVGGERVTPVIRRDGAGHAADAQGGADPAETADSGDAARQFVRPSPER